MEPKTKSKTCFKCNAQKSLGEFYAHPRMADGHLGKCKECTKADVRQRRLDHPERLAGYEQRRRQDPKRREAQLRYAVSARRRKSAEYRAHYLARSALRDGRLIPKPCERCGSTEAIEAHHDDYYQPLKVRWLCFRCHLAKHGKAANVDRRFKHKGGEA